MEISNDNMFSTGYGLLIDNKPYLVREKVKVKPHRLDRWHLVTEGDRLELLAFKYYGQYTIDSQNWWWVIADANGISNPLSISQYIGRYFLIPDFFRFQLLLNEMSEEARSFGDHILDIREESNTSFQVEIYDSTIGSDGSLEPLPNGQTGQVNQTNPSFTSQRVRLFFEMQNNGGYKVMYLDRDGHIEYKPDNPNNYLNSLIVESPI